MLNDRLEEDIGIAVAKNRQWLLVKSDKIDSPDSFVKSIFKHHFVGGVSINEGAIMVLFKKRRNNGGCFKGIPEQQFFGLLAPPGVCDAKNFYINFMKDFLKSGPKVWVNYVIVPAPPQGSSSSFVPIDTAIDSVADKTKKMDSDQFEKEIIKSKMSDKDSRTIAFLVAGCLSSCWVCFWLFDVCLVDGCLSNDWVSV